MIIGIGTDIVEIARIERALARTGSRLAERILAPDEQALWQQSARPAQMLAKRFAIKEATAKALGTGIAQGISWHHIRVEHDALGAPLLRLEGAAEARARALGVSRVHVSVSDEQQHAVAFVVLEGREERGESRHDE